MKVRTAPATGPAIARKPAFLQWLALIVAMGIATFFCGWFGLLTRIWRDDSSHMSSVVAALVIGTAAYIGYLCWRVPERTTVDLDEFVDIYYERLAWIEDGAEWCPVAETLSPAIGLVGTIFGLEQQAVALREGGDVLGLLGTALYSTLAGVTGLAVVVVLSYVLASALRGARRHG